MNVRMMEGKGRYYRRLQGFQIFFLSTIGWVLCLLSASLATDLVPITPRFQADHYTLQLLPANG